MKRRVLKNKRNLVHCLFCYYCGRILVHVGIVVADVFSTEYGFLCFYCKSIAKQQIIYRYKVETFYDWLNRYKNGGLDNLTPGTRSDAGVSKKITEKVVDIIKQIISDFPYLSISGIYRMLIFTNFRCMPRSLLRGVSLCKRTENL